MATSSRHKRCSWQVAAAIGYSSCDVKPDKEVYLYPRQQCQGLQRGCGGVLGQLSSHQLRPPAQLQRAGSPAATQHVVAQMLLGTGRPNTRRPGYTLGCVRRMSEGCVLASFGTRCTVSCTGSRVHCFASCVLQSLTAALFSDIRVHDKALRTSFPQCRRLHNLSLLEATAVHQMQCKGLCDQYHPWFVTSDC